MGVGFGFGLQNIISNFISGLIILAERPIAIGDRVEIGGVAGQVREISLRSTTVITNDNMAIIVPNADFITQRVTNWSYEDPRVRFRIPFGVAYGTDLPKLRKLMLEVADEHPKALKDPKPELFFVGFGDSSLNFELGVWSSEVDHLAAALPERPVLCHREEAARERHRNPLPAAGPACAHDAWVTPSPVRALVKPTRRARAHGEDGGANGELGMVIASPGFSRLKSTFGLAALMALTGRPYIRAMVAALSPGPRT